MTSILKFTQQYSYILFILRDISIDLSRKFTYIILIVNYGPI